VAAQPGPKIVVVQDLDRPHPVGAFWGEVNANMHKALARRLCVGHAHSWPVRWNCAVEVFGRAVQPGQLIHADKLGFLALPDEDVSRVLESARLMDANECSTLIAAARSASGKTTEQFLAEVQRAAADFGRTASEAYQRKAEF